MSLSDSSLELCVLSIHTIVTTYVAGYVGTKFSSYNNTSVVKLLPKFPV